MYEIHRQITAIYGERAISRPGIVKWCQQFDGGRTDITDKYREGRPVTSSSVANIDRVDAINKDNRHIKLQEIASMLNISYASVFSIVHEHLG